MNDGCNVYQTMGRRTKGHLDSEQMYNPGITGTMTRPRGVAGQLYGNPGITGTSARPQDPK